MTIMYMHARWISKSSVTLVCRSTFCTKGLSGCLINIYYGDLGELEKCNIKQYCRAVLDEESQYMSSASIPDAGQSVGSIDVHGTRTTDTFSTRPPKGQGRVHFILDLN